MLSRRIPTLIGFGDIFLTAVKVHGDFVAPYGLTPPDPGSYSVLAGGVTVQFGNWWGKPTARAMRVDTTFAPTNLVLDTERVSRGVAAYFWSQAAAAGTVSFEYTIAGESVGSFSWFNNASVSVGGVTGATFLGTTNDLVSSPTSVSFPVQAGEYFGFHLTAVGNMIPLVLAQRLVTIRNFSAPGPVVGLPTISIHDVIVPEPTNATANAVFDVRLSAAHTQAVSVAYTTTNGTAAAGSDYTAASGTVTFEPGETNKTISVAVLADAIPEGNETFNVILGNPTNATLAKSLAIGTINELRILALAFHIDVSFNSVTGAAYRVEWSEDGIDWTAVPGSENVPGTGSIVTVTHSNAACNPSRIYRVLLLE